MRGILVVAGVIGGCVILIAMFGSGGGSANSTPTYSEADPLAGVADTLRPQFQTSLWLVIKILAANLTGRSQLMYRVPNLHRLIKLSACLQPYACGEPHGFRADARV
jgi:Na+/pantothenate symporter